MNNPFKTLCLLAVLSWVVISVHGQEASDALIDMVDKVHAICPRAFVPGMKLSDVEIDEENVVCSFLVGEGFAQRGNLASDRNRESMKASLLKNLGRMNRSSILRQMAEEIADCEMGVKGVVSDEGGGDELEVTITNDELRTALGKQREEEE